MNVLGIDFEDWYHPELIKKNIKNEKHNPTVINGIDKILDLLRKHETFATFFVVGELLEIKPDIFDKIIENDHEIGFHTMYHDRLDSPGFEGKFSDEVKKFKKLTDGNHVVLGLQHFHSIIRAHGQLMFWKKMITRMIVVLFPLKLACMEHQMQNTNHIELQVNPL